MKTMREKHAEMQKQLEVMEHALNGGAIEFLIKHHHDLGWVKFNGPTEELTWDWQQFEYRKYEGNKPSIDWSAVSSKYNYMATDKCGTTYLYRSMPSICDSIWCTPGGGHIFANLFASFLPGDCDWKDSLVSRDE